VSDVAEGSHGIGKKHHAKSAESQVDGLGLEAMGSGVVQDKLHLGSAGSGNTLAGQSQLLIGYINAEHSLGPTASANLRTVVPVPQPMSKTRSPRTGAAPVSAASVTSAISWSMRVCSVTQGRVASLFQNVRCAIATVSVSLMTRCPSVFCTVNDRPQMASAERVAVMSERVASGRHGGGPSTRSAKPRCYSAVEASLGRLLC
jgi:hypothetical protein